MNWFQLSYRDKRGKWRTTKLGFIVSYGIAILFLIGLALWFTTPSGQDYACWMKLHFPQRPNIWCFR